MAYCALHKAAFRDDEGPHCIEDRLEELEDDCDEMETGEYFDCHMDRRGSCGKAGSEECEFECPYRADQREEERRKGLKQAGKRK